MSDGVAAIDGPLMRRCAARRPHLAQLAPVVLAGRSFPTGAPSALTGLRGRGVEPAVVPG
jgi:hypothetical protein